MQQIASRIRTLLRPRSRRSASRLSAEKAEVLKENLRLLLLTKETLERQTR